MQSQVKTLAKHKHIYQSQEYLHQVQLSYYLLGSCILSSLSLWSFTNKMYRWFLITVQILLYHQRHSNTSRSFIKKFLNMKYGI